MSHLIIRIRQQPIVARQQESVHSEDSLNLNESVSCECSLRCKDERPQDSVPLLGNEIGIEQSDTAAPS